ncbi:MAG: cysteine desulfurase [Pseudomonadota bacterium]|jgi:cysteine desulfurase / selenocysteine lyase
MTDKRGMPFDAAGIRAQFPILRQMAHGKPLAYLDNAASAQKPEAVLKALDDAYRTSYANIHRGAHYLSMLATEKYEAAREKVRGFLNAREDSEIIFTSNATSALNLVAASFARPKIKEGDEIILSVMEHHSNIVPWHFLRAEKGAVLKWAPVDGRGELQLDELEKLISPRTRLLTITHVSNVLGTITPVREIVRMAHAHGVPVLVDGSQAAPHLPIDVQELDCDFYVFTGHKVYGPTGIGVLYGKSAHLAAMPPFLGGGEMIMQVTPDNVTYADPPFRFEAGTMPIVEAIGLGAAVDFLQSLDRTAIIAHEKRLLDYATERLSEVNAVTIYGRAREKGSILSFNVDGIHSHDLATIIDQSGVAVRSGQHCAEPLMRHLGVTASARASFALYNTVEEVDALARAVESCRKMFAR